MLFKRHVISIQPVVYKKYKKGKSLQGLGGTNNFYYEERVFGNCCEKNITTKIGNV
jgi:hypothetical protein